MELILGGAWSEQLTGWTAGGAGEGGFMQLTLCTGTVDSLLLLTTTAAADHEWRP